MTISLKTGNCQGPVVKPVFKERQGYDNFFCRSSLFLRVRHIFFQKNIREFTPHSLALTTAFAILIHFVRDFRAQSSDFFIPLRSQFGIMQIARAPTVSSNPVNGSFII